MRIAYLTQSYPPMVSGAAIVAAQLAKGMANRGHEVLVIAASNNGNQYVVRQKNITVLRLASSHNPLRVNQRFILFPGSSVLKALHKFQPDIIHTHEPIQMGHVGLKYARSAGTPIILTTHQLPWFVASYLPEIPVLRTLVEKALWRYARWILGCFTCTISPTKTISKIIKARTGRKTITLQNGIELRTFHPQQCNEEAMTTRAKLNIPAAAPVLLHVGRLDMDKRVDRVVLASADILRKSDAHLLIVGDGNQKPALFNLCKSLGIETCVHFTGFISHKDKLAKLYRASTIFVTASEIETQGIVLIEAAACGLPIAAVNATCIPEIVHDGINGFLAQPGSISALSEAIGKILGNPAGANSMKIQSRLLAKKYETEFSFGRHEKLYHRILKQHQELRVSTNSRFRKKIRGSHRVKLEYENYSDHDQP
jgi:1,2-diacylglycerol 3-alpha-glucosyltransferase